MLDYEDGIYILIEQFPACHGPGIQQVQPVFSISPEKWGQAIVTGTTSETHNRAKLPSPWERKPVIIWVGVVPVEQGDTDFHESIPLFIRSMKDMGFDVKFLAADFKRIEPWFTKLERMGIDTLEGQWFRGNWQSWVKDYSQIIDYVYFDQLDHLLTFGPSIESNSQAAFLYHICDSAIGDADLNNSEVITSGCDLVLVDNHVEEQALLNRYPNKQIYCLPESMQEAKVILETSKDESLLRLAKTLEKTSPQPPPRVIAFYLPQYHPIPENNRWWGEGFTEWHNVRKTEPLFEGHYQPHVPADLGYYDLRNEEVRIAQAELAKTYGIEGFCYYHYWFKGKRLLERPLEDLIESGKPDFPFCICWANEHWSRRWDGKDQELLMNQEYSEQDDLDHIQYLITLFKDPRYIRINGKPVLLIYRAENIPDASRTADIWRAEVRKAGLDGVYLCRVESFVKGDPREFRFDASVEFAPDWWNKGPQLFADSEMLGDAGENIKKVCDNNYIHSYGGLVDAMLAKEKPAYTWIRCVTPSWDNWARRHKGASVFLESTPEKYQQWLADVVDDTNLRLHGEERIVFVNAWNEWAEGNHLEPDQKFGHAYLEATRQARLQGQISTTVKRLAATDEARVNRLTSLVASQEYQLNELQLQLHDLLESTSWRATLPLRWVKQRILDLKKLISGLK